MDSLAVMASKVLHKEESNYIENILKACAEDLSIRTYKVLRENTLVEITDRIDTEIDFNPLLELAAQPLNLRFLDVHKWIAILVEYEDK